ncbi:MAG: response regulator, partial [Bacteroidetes bacterium]|nr:response regulator [Bacteroidota bacterium]
GILGFAELLKQPGLTGEQQQEYIRIIEKGGTRMLNIINDIVDISRIESKQVITSLSETNIIEQIEYIYMFFKPEVENKGINLLIKNELQVQDAIVVTDREKLYATLTNLVKNAIKYTEKGSIEFGCKIIEMHGRASLQFYVKDTGIGIPKDRQEAIFERFIQADIEDKMARQGAGLGLAISKAYVEMLGGSMWLKSKENTGSTFYFELPYNPVMDVQITAKSRVLEELEENKINNLKILIVEDDETSAQLISIVLSKTGREIITAQTAEEAVEACHNHPDIDLIMMDIQLPEMNGYEATRQIRKFNTSVVIIAQTAFAMSGDKEKALEAGCDDYISKPINTDELIQLIGKHFKK